MLVLIDKNKISSAIVSKHIFKVYKLQVIEQDVILIVAIVCYL